MRKLLLLLLTVISVSVSAQYQPSGSKVRYVNGVAFGTKSDAAFGTVDSAVLYASADSTLKFKYRAIARSLAYADSVQSITFANVRDYGAVGNGTTDDRTAFVNALASGKPVVVPFGRYYLSNTITLSNGQSITGYGDTSAIYVNGNYSAFQYNGNSITIIGIKIIGSGRGTSTDYVTTRPNQNGILIDAGSGYFYNNRIDRVSFDSLGGAGINYLKNHRGDRLTSLAVSNVIATSCWKGYNLGDRAEYSVWTNTAAAFCEYGIWQIGGNNNFVGGALTGCKTGFYLKGGINDGHSDMVGFKINHSLYNSVEADSIYIGYRISSTAIYYADIKIRNSIGLKFANCNIYADSVVVSNSPHTSFDNILWERTPNFAIDVPSQVQFFGSDWVEVADSRYPNQVFNALKVPVQTGKIIKTNTDSTVIAAVAGTDYQLPITNPVTGTGTNGYLSKWNSSSSQNISSAFDDGVNIGIGTTTPTAIAGYKPKLEIKDTYPAHIWRNNSSQSVGIAFDGTMFDFFNNISYASWASISANGIKTNQYRLSALNTAPSSASDTGTLGEIRIDANYIYICTATNTWKRVAISTW